MSVDADFPLLRFARQLSIAHHVPGRIRLKLNGPIGGDLKAMADQAKRFANSLSAMAGIRSVTLNPLAKSCTIEYDVSVISSSAWSGFLSGSNSPGSDVLLRTVIAATRI